MSLLTQGIPQVTAAAKAGMSERTARKYAHSGRAPSQAKVPHTWRTRPDPFADVWPEVEALLRQDGGLQAKTIWAELNERHAGRFSAGQLRTLQRRLLAWRAKSGPDREVFFPQTHSPGEQAQSDFTGMRRLEVMIAGQLFPHLLYHFVLTYSNWECVSICPSESFEFPRPSKMYWCSRSRQTWLMPILLFPETIPASSARREWQGRRDAAARDCCQTTVPRVR